MLNWFVNWFHTLEVVAGSQRHYRNEKHRTTGSQIAGKVPHDNL